MSSHAHSSAARILDTVHHVLTHVVASLLDGFAAITGFYYSKKYAAVVKRLGLRPDVAQDGARPGLIILQIDGLSYEYLQQMLARHRLPNLQRMLHKGGYVLARWRCGLPSTTPAAQAGIMFGQNDNIPAFRWYEKDRDLSWGCQAPGPVAVLERDITANRKGLLTGGVSYVNIFDGDAARSFFTLSALHPRRIFESVRGVGFLMLFLLNPLRTLRLIYLIIKEYITDGLQRLSSRFHGQRYIPFSGSRTFLRIFSNVIFREVVTFAVLVDIYRGVPAIYATFYGFDDIAHHFALDSIAAHQALGEIDRHVGQIERLRRAKLSRAYQTVVLSDHGMTAAEPFAHRFGQSLGQYIGQQLGESTFLTEHANDEEHSLAQAGFLLDELRAIERNLRPRAARVARRIRIVVQRRLSRARRPLVAWNEQRRHDVVVKDSGSLAHVYFNIQRQRMDLSDVAEAFPDLVVKLLAHEGIWLVVAREGKETLIMSRRGILSRNGDGSWRTEGQNPLLRLPEPQLAAEQICRLASFRCSGDLILLGSYDPGRKQVISFEEQWAAHGGLGGPQDYPFILYPRRLQWHLAQVQNSCDLYPLLAQERGLGQPAEAQPTPST
jgi:hypothetical protein